MRLFKFLFPPRPTSAVIAKERLKIVLAHERAGSQAPDFLPKLQKELIEVVGRYVEIRDDMIRVNLGKSGETSLLEINIEIEGAKPKTAAVPPPVSKLAPTPAVATATATAATAPASTAPAAPAVAAPAPAATAAAPAVAGVKPAKPAKPVKSAG